MASETLNVLVFGILRERAGQDTLHVELPQGATVKDLKAAVAQQYANVAEGLAFCRVAVDGDYARDGDILNPKVEVALIPPVAGGTSARVFVQLQTEPIDEDGVRAWIADNRCGGNSLFSGSVRDQHHDRQVTHLIYEVYPDMAERLLVKIAEQACNNFVLQKAAIVHRHGRLDIGDVAVTVAASAVHRSETFAAVAWMMDRIKADAPIWKHEFYSDGTDEWVRCRHGAIQDEVYA